jgi:hypothetical protein
VLTRGLRIEPEESNRLVRYHRELAVPRQSGRDPQRN